MTFCIKNSIIEIGRKPYSLRIRLPRINRALFVKDYSRRIFMICLIFLKEML
nr:MAG TPA: hypothetical protein [Caudoviricetes sp.]DAN53290.1 MAG TPA: hypothetical protein [Caudoviricetes sp.]DAR90136.1 MAG TPA: hypothetical protein [Caudoviricetes sp.]